MTFTTFILYPTTEGSSFNLSYYNTSHMPLVEKVWSAHGLQSWKVIEFSTGPDGSAPAYKIGAECVFDSPESFQKAMADEGTKGVFADLPNYTDIKPVILRGGVVAKGGKL